MQVTPVDQVTDREHNHRWWKEVLFIAAFYGIYSVVRNQFGSVRLGRIFERIGLVDFHFHHRNIVGVLTVYYDE